MAHHREHKIVSLITCGECGFDAWYAVGNTYGTRTMIEGLVCGGCGNAVEFTESYVEASESSATVLMDARRLC